MTDTARVDVEGQVRPGRPRDPDVDEAIIRATVELLAEHGYARLTMDRVALKAAVAKTSLYRRWPSKESLVIDAIQLARIGEGGAVPDRGCLRKDMLTYLRSLVRHHRAQSDAISAVTSETLSNRDVAQAFRHHVVGGMVAGFRLIIERAVERRELPPSTDVELMALLPLALVNQHRMLSGEQVDEGLIKRIVDQFFTRPSVGATPIRLPGLVP